MKKHKKNVELEIYLGDYDLFIKDLRISFENLLKKSIYDMGKKSSYCGVCGANSDGDILHHNTDCPLEYLKNKIETIQDDFNEFISEFDNDGKGFATCEKCFWMADDRCCENYIPKDANKLCYKFKINRNK